MLHGHTVYFGSSNKLMSYFIEQGIPYKEHDNPADFALDVLNGASSPSAAQDLYEKYRSSSEHSRNISTSSSDSYEHEICVVQQPDRSFTSDFFYVSQRTLRNAIRNSALLTWQIIVAITLGVLTGLLYYKLPRTTDSGVQNRLGGIFFIVVNQIFSTATALEPFIKERALFIHVCCKKKLIRFLCLSFQENISGYYSISTLFLAKLVCDVLPMRVIPSLVFSIICYFMTGLQRNATNFLIFLCTIFMANVFGSAMCFFIAASIPVFGKNLL
jgi:ATP-binding cassette subfamily G (WHITE) protein 2